MNLYGRLRSILFVAALCAAGSAGVAAEDKPHSDRDRKEDAARHRAMARAHEAVAACLDAGKPEKECLERLRKDCKGLGIGKYCGMKHQH